MIRIYMKKWSYCTWKFLIDFQHDKQLFFNIFEIFKSLINYCLKSCYGNKKQIMSICMSMQRLYKYLHTYYKCSYNNILTNLFTSLPIAFCCNGWTIYICIYLSFKEGEHFFHFLQPPFPLEKNDHLSIHFSSKIDGHFPFNNPLYLFLLLFALELFF